MQESLQSQLEHLHHIFSGIDNLDPKTTSNYAWTVVKMLHSHISDIRPLTARQLLADCIKLPIERPSKLYSALLSAAIRVSENTDDLHFVPFLQLWDLRHLRHEDHEPQPDPSSDKTFPSLADKLIRRYIHSFILRPDERLSPDQFAVLIPLLTHKGYCISTSAPQIDTATGYILSIDPLHGHIHIFDEHSRHFVATQQPSSTEKAGDFVHFIPIIPQTSKFKSALIISPVACPSSLFRQIKITAINTEKHYASWELTDKSRPITEQLSPLQISLGESSPSYTNGFISLTDDNRLPAAVASIQPQLTIPSIHEAFIFLRRGKDNLKRPHIACIKY